MRKLIISLLLVFSCVCVVLAQASLSVSNIPDSLKINADAVVRFHTTNYYRTSNASCSKETNYAVTILNPKGAKAALLQIYYDSNTRVSDVKGVVYGANGRVIHKLKKKDIVDMVANASYTLFSDHRVKTYSPGKVIVTYPYTVEYQYTEDYNGVVGFDTWLPQEQYRQAVEKAELNFYATAKYDIRYRALNGNFDFQRSVDDKKIAYHWKVENLMAVTSKAHAPNYFSFMPLVLLAPTKIDYEGSTGDFSSWNTYGKWVYSLVEGRDELSEKTADHIEQLVANIDDDRERIRVIYEYMQNNTRYINVALGIGGFQPIKAEDVDDKGYGDCKALSNYTKALLNYAGIESYYTEIGSGEYRQILFPDFASANQTNHIIICVPNKGDTVWLECTSQNIPFGYIGRSNMNRYALLIKPNGGELVRTPAYSSEKNRRSSFSQIHLLDDGAAQLEIDASYYNSAADAIRRLVKESPKEQKNQISDYLSVNGLYLIGCKLIEDKRKLEYKLELDGRIKQYASKTGKRLIITPEFFLDYDMIREIDENRKLAIHQSCAYSYQDTIQINMPLGFQVEHLPKAMEVASALGCYKYELEVVEQSILLVRSLQLNQGEYHTHLFEELRVFLEKMKAADKAKIILNKEWDN